jgi:hypothetical protein
MLVGVAMLIAAASVTAAIGSAPTAHADEQELEAGYHACADMRAGASPAT